MTFDETTPAPVPALGVKYEMEIADELMDEANTPDPLDSEQTQIGLFTDTGWVPPDRELADDEWRIVFKTIRRKRDGTNWQYGDAVLACQNVRGETYVQFAEEAECSVEHIKNCMRVARNFPQSFHVERFQRGRLPWSYYRTVSGPDYDHETRDALLVRAEHGDGTGKPWTHTEFQQAIFFLTNESDEAEIEEAESLPPSDDPDEAKQEEEVLRQAKVIVRKRKERSARRSSAKAKRPLRSGDNEWNTPPEHIEAIHRLLGVIDLDPASNAHAQKTVQATEFYTARDDGLSKDWRGRVYLNPPYAFPLVSHFVDKLCESFASGHVTEAVLLTQNNTDTSWWHRAARASSAICFTAGRISFHKTDGVKSQPTNGHTFFYFGKNVDGFQSNFGAFGVVMVEV